MTTSTTAAGNRDHFIPVSKRQLNRSVRRRLAPSQQTQDAWDRFFRRLELLFHLEYHDRLDQLKADYAPFDPDAGSIEAALAEASGVSDPESFFAAFRDLLVRANYRELSHEAIEQAMQVASEFGVRTNIELDAFKHLVVFVRGDSTIRRTFRSWRTCFRPCQVDVPVYERLIVAFQLDRKPRTDAPVQLESIYVKLFQNVPHADVNMLLPCSGFHMRWIDRLRIAVPTLSGIGLTVAKIVKGGIVLAVTGFYGLVAFLGLVGATIGYGIKSFFSYLQTKDKYQLALTQSLYYQNLDNNLGVLSHLVDRAEEQDVCEAAVAYYVLWRAGRAERLDAATVDRRAEMLLSELTTAEIDFEVDDGLRKLERLELASCDDGGCWTGVPLEEASRRLGRHLQQMWQ